MYGLRKGLYPYPLNHLSSNGGTDSSAFVFGDDTVVADSNNWYVLCLTPDQLLQLSSVIAVGAPICYPDNYIVIQNIISQMRQFPNTIPEDTCMDLCQLIIDCINDTTALQDVIASYANGGVTAQLTDAPDETIQGTDISGGQSASCNDDNLFGMVTGLVDLINNMATDIIEQITASANVAARAGDMIESIPVIGVLPFDDALQITESFLDDIAQNYAANYTTSLRDEYRCDLFCLAQDNGCVLTFEMVFDYFNDRLVTGITTIDMEDVLEYFTQGTFSGVELVDAWHAFVSGLMMFGASITGIDDKKMLKIVAALWNDPDSDWSILCDCGTEWTQTFDFSVNDGGFTIYSPAGDGNMSGGWNSTDGWYAADNKFADTPAQWRKYVAILIDFTESYITELTYVVDFVKGSYSSSVTAEVSQTQLSGVQQSSQSESSDAITTESGKTYSIFPESNADQVRVFISSSSQSSAVYSGSAKIRSVTIKGTGTNPFV